MVKTRSMTRTYSITSSRKINNKIKKKKNNNNQQITNEQITNEQITNEQITNEQINNKQINNSTGRLRTSNNESELIDDETLERFEKIEKLYTKDEKERYLSKDKKTYAILSIKFLCLPGEMTFLEGIKFTLFSTVPVRKYIINCNSWDWVSQYKYIMEFWKNIETFQQYKNDILIKYIRKKYCTKVN